MQNFHSLKIKRATSEIPLFIAVLLISLLAWAALIASVLGIIYVLIFSFITFIGHIAAISHIRGSGIKVSQEQLPDLYNSVAKISTEIGLKKVPEIYVIQGNGLLNAMATKFACTRIFVIYSNLLDACESDASTLNMIIGHELGHLDAGHLRWNWLIWPGLCVPFLGSALSRAREYTADRYGAFVTKNTTDAIRGLILLAGGKNIAPKVSPTAFTSQLKNINTGMMRIGEWLHSHPTLVRRICALEPEIKKEKNQRAILSLLTALTIITSTLVAVPAGIITLAHYTEGPATEFMARFQHPERDPPEPAYADNNNQEDVQPRNQQQAEEDELLPNRMSI